MARGRTCEGVREIRAIEMFTNESIMTLPMAITRIYRARIMHGVCEHSGRLNNARVIYAFVLIALLKANVTRLSRAKTRDSSLVIHVVPRARPVPQS